MSRDFHRSHVTDREEMADAMLDLAEQALRACLDAGLGMPLKARAARLLAIDLSQPRQDPPPLPAPVAPLQGAAPGHLNGIDLSLILGCLKAARASRLTPSEVAANMLARGKVLRAMRDAEPIAADLGRAAA